MNLMNGAQLVMVEMNLMTGPPANNSNNYNRIHYREFAPLSISTAENQEGLPGVHLKMIDLQWQQEKPEEIEAGMKTEGTLFSNWKSPRQGSFTPWLSILVALLIFAPMLRAADRCNGAELGEVEQRTAQDIGFPKIPLFASPRIDLDDTLIYLQFMYKGSIAERKTSGLPMGIVRILVFDLAHQGYHLKDGFIVQEAIDLDEAPTWRVGYNCSTGAIYHLNGFEDSEQSFNSLISELGIKVDSTNSALEIFRTFADLTFQGGRQEIIRRKIDLLRIALDQYSGKDNTRSFFAYWKKISKLKQENLLPTVSASGEQFRVTGFVGDEAGIQNVSLLISPDGRVHLQNQTVVFHWPAQK
jgi:hypothetical protein